MSIFFRQRSKTLTFQRSRLGSSKSASANSAKGRNIKSQQETPNQPWLAVACFHTKG